MGKRIDGFVHGHSGWCSDDLVGMNGVWLGEAKIVKTLGYSKGIV